MHKTILKQFLTTIYSDGTSKITEIKRDEQGRFLPENGKAAKRAKPKTPRQRLIDPDDIPGLDEHGNVTRRVTCPDCGLVFMRSFKILKEV